MNVSNEHTITERGPMDLSRLLPGFADPVHDAQASFRSVLHALAEPGRIAELPVKLSAPFGLGVARAAVLLALSDYDTPVHLAATLREGEAAAWLRFHSGCTLVETTDEAHFLVLDGLAQLPAAEALQLGSASYPDRSATLLVEVPELAEGGPIRLSGPGIEHSRSISVGGWTGATTRFMQANRARFPLGVDLLLTCGDRLMGLPRTVVVEA
ncbi:phosphonate C-P lyase system protein PhnH [Niveibacterium sp. SC-1]|uniref:phosphonate C-P lyase system protein PhnH n=1 Tax=Niveibacterium sp. SC-1 TaxID=3135646 RepID=UPI00311E5B8D